MATLNVGMGEIKVSKTAGDVITAPGLGSCIGLILYDKKQKIAGMAHVVLPDSTASKKINAHPGKYADTAIPELLIQLEKLGAKKKDLVAKLAGGSQMFTFDKGSNVLNIGMRNNLAVKAALSKENIKAVAADTGGNKGRTLRITLSDCDVIVKSIGQEEKPL